MPRRTARLSGNTEPAGAPQRSAPNPDAPSLPPGWAWTTLKEIATLIKPGFPSGQHNQEGRGVPHLRPMNIDWKGVIDLAEVKFVEPSREYECLQEGDVLFNNTNSPPLVGKTALIRHDTNWAFSNHMTLIRLERSVVEPAWAAWYLHHLFWAGFFRLHCRHHVNQASINTSFLKRISLPLAPLPEQRRIVARIEELFSQLDAAEEGLRRVQRNLKRYRAAVLKAAVEGRLVPTEAELARATGRTYETGAELLQRILAERRRKWEKQEWAKLVEKAKKKAAQARRKARGLPARMKDIPPEEWQAIPEEEYRRYLPKDDRWKQKYREPVPPDTANLPPLPEGWTWATVGMVGEVKGGKRVPKGHSYATGPTPHPYIRVTDFVEGTVRIEGLKYLKPETFEKIRKYTISSKDVFISIAGTIGVTGIVPEFLDGANLTENAAKITSLQGILPQYLHFILSSPYGQERISSRIISTNQPKLALFRIATIPIPLPPLAEQRRIVAEVERRFSVAREAEKAVETNLKRIARLRQAILKRAFEGKLVPQDPSDEPAEVLLQRIERKEAV